MSTSTSPPADTSVRPGTVALLRRVSPVHAGRLVLVQRPARATTGAQARSASPGRHWHVTALGREIFLRATGWREVCVDADCLQALCWLKPAQARWLSKRQALMDFDQALADARRCLARHPLTDAELDAALETAAQEASDRLTFGLMPLLPKLHQPDAACD